MRESDSEEMSQNPFDQKKRAILSQIESTDETHPDASPKGTLDVLLLPLIDVINSHSDYVTTSSCSGRVSVFLEGMKTASELGGKGDGGKWLFITHDPEELKSTDWWSLVTDHREHVSESDVSAGVSSIGNGEPAKYDGQRYVLYKFEAMILHVKCRDRASASALYTAAMSCGFRESGIGSNDLVGIRISLRLDVPIAYLNNDGTTTPLVPRQYIDHLQTISLDLFNKNTAKINQLHRTVASMIQAQQTAANKPQTAKETKEQRRERKHREGLLIQAQTRQITPEAPL
ncbi:Tyw3p [Sugiyamaella lignohabitans]|uniref:tRNA wybutosine-synthesizing protein 3 n=1 Tax=Sugiyamaella lignohabitans TaxID=796027 RepID=A0A167EVU9_9ASCO|nr:Tyw3p [Sugiyamaella lignohabitans]ANB14524.1 Tyw3p [Sugiyamaella lignohabitans]